MSRTQGGLPTKKRVNLDLKNCTCFYTDQYRMPCRHIMAALAFFGRLQEVYALYGGCYHVSSYALLYLEDSPIQSPIDQDLESTDISSPEKAIMLGRHTIK